MSKRGYVYFIRSGDGLLKIGRTNDVEKRFQTIKTSCPRGAELEGFIKTVNQFDLEKKLHNHFADCRVHGEWFDLDTSEVFDTYLTNMRDEIIKGHINQAPQKQELVKLLLELDETRETIFYDEEPPVINAIYHNKNLYILPVFLKERLGANVKRIRSDWMREGYIDRFPLGLKWVDGTVIKHNGKAYRVIQVSPTILNELNLNFSI
jgi:hypothetical protein